MAYDKTIGLPPSARQFDAFIMEAQVANSASVSGAEGCEGAMRNKFKGSVARSASARVPSYSGRAAKSLVAAGFGLLLAARCSSASSARRARRSMN